MDNRKRFYDISPVQFAALTGESDPVAMAHLASLRIVCDPDMSNEVVMRAWEMWDYTTRIKNDEPTDDEAPDE